MNSRERFQATMRYGKSDRPFLWEKNAYRSTVARWLGEGLPAGYDYKALLGFDRREVAEVEVGLWPPFKARLLKNRGGYVDYLDEDGMVKRQTAAVYFRDYDQQPSQGPDLTGMAQRVRPGLRDRRSWKAYRARLDPETPGRFPDYWAELKPIFKGRDYALGANGGSLYGWLRNWMGLEGLSYALHDDPAWVEEMADTVSWCIAETLKRQLVGVDYDFLALWEDMAFKTGPLIDPEMYSRLFGKYWRRVIDVARGAGLDSVSIDSDGCVWELIPVWLDWGINCVWPMEVAAGMDVAEARRRFGRGLRMMGGIDKRVLAFGGKAEIKAMVERVGPVVEDGGYVPMVDHATPPDVSWENFVYYRSLLYGLEC